MTVVVAGPPFAGTSSVVAVLRELMPETLIVEAGHPAARDAQVAVLVASAVARLTPSECVEFAGLATHRTIGAVTKVDAHRRWRNVLAANRALFDVPWVPVAAAPDVGSPDVDELVAGIRNALAQKLIRTPVQLRAKPQTRDGQARALAVRTGLQRERTQLGGLVRQCCAAWRSELRAAASTASPRRAAEFEAAARRQADAVLRDVDDRIAERMAALASELTLAAPGRRATRRVELPVSAVQSGGAERGLTVALGAGFGLGVGLAVGRLLADVVPALAGAATAVGVLVGLALAVWLVRTRSVLRRRVELDRWVVESAAALRGQAEDRVAEAVIAAEVDFAAELRRS